MMEKNYSNIYKDLSMCSLENEGVKYFRSAYRMTGRRELINE